VGRNSITPIIVAIIRMVFLSFTFKIFVTNSSATKYTVHPTAATNKNPQIGANILRVP
jgi:hypothetical protein